MFASKSELEAAIEFIKLSPKDDGVVRKIVCRPTTGERIELMEAQLDVVEGLAGDNWRSRGYQKTPDGSAHPDMQLNIMNARQFFWLLPRATHCQTESLSHLRHADSVTFLLSSLRNVQRLVRSAR